MSDKPRWVLKVIWKEGSRTTTAARRFLFKDADLRQEIPMPCGCTQVIEADACLRKDSDIADIHCRNHADQIVRVEVRRMGAKVA